MLFCQNTLGLCTEKGIGMAKNEAEAVILYRKAAAQHFDLAACNLARCCRDGIGISKDLVEAKRFFSLAAEWGHSDALVSLRELSREEEPPM